MTLLSVMMVLSVMALMTLGAARYALWGERLSQGERDLAVSFEAAEAALLDAEWDVMGLRTDPANGEASKRHCDFVAAEFLANTRPGAAVCGQGQSVGVCFDAAHPGQAWRQASPWLRTEVGQAAQNRTVAYGQFTEPDSAAGAATTLCGGVGAFDSLGGRASPRRMGDHGRRFWPQPRDPDLVAGGVGQTRACCANALCRHHAGAAKSLAIPGTPDANGFAQTLALSGSACFDRRNRGNALASAALRATQLA